MFHFWLSCVLFIFLLWVFCVYFVVFPDVEKRKLFKTKIFSLRTWCDGEEEEFSLKILFLFLRFFSYTPLLLLLMLCRQKWLLTTWRILCRQNKKLCTHTHTHLWASWVSLFLCVYFSVFVLTTQKRSKRRSRGEWRNSTAAKAISFSLHTKTNPFSFFFLT